MKTKPNDPAAPLMPSHTDPKSITETFAAGVTKRELFAAMAMQGLASKDYSNLPASSSQEISNAICRTSTEMADALIEALNKE